MESVSATCTQCGHNFFIEDPLCPRGPRVPLILACSHVVCETCLTSGLHQTGSVTCKKCDHVSTGLGINAAQIEDVMKEYPVHLNMLGLFAKQFESQPPLEDSAIQFTPAGASEQLPAGITKFGDTYTLTMSSNVVGPMKIMCDECLKKLAVWKCKQCAMTYCDSCSQKAHKIKSKMSHERTAMVVSPARKPAVEEQVAKCCLEHPQQKLEFFCRDCNELVCEFCTMPGDSRHRAHDVGAVSDMNKEYLLVLHASLEVANRVQQRLKNAELALSAMNGPQGSIADAEQEDKLVLIAQQYVDHFAWFQAALQRKQAAILDQLTGAASEANKKREAVKEAISQHIQHVEGLIESAEGILDNTETVDLMHLIPLAQQLRDLNQLPCDLAIQKQVQPFRCEAVEAQAQVLLREYEQELSPLQDVKLVRVEEMDADWSIVPITDCTFVDTPEPDAALPESSPASSVCDLDASDRSSATQGFIPPQTQELVKVCNAKDPSNFYVQRILDVKSLQGMDNRIKYVVLKQRSISPTEALEDHLCLAKYTINKKWYRARVRPAPHTVDSLQQVDVFYIDYGNYDKVPVSDLRSLPLEFKTIPPLALRCSLALVSPLAGNKWDANAVKWFTNICRRTCFNCSVYAFNGDRYEVDIGQIPNGISKGVPLSVADALVFLEYAQKADESAMEHLQIQRSGFPIPKQPKSYSENQDFKEGDEMNAMVSHVNNPHSFYVRRMDDNSKYVDECTKHLTSIYAKLVPRHGERDWRPIYAPTIGMACAALYLLDGKWYRAKVVSLPGHKMVGIQYVDYGAQATVLYKDIRILKEEFFRVPALAKHCSLADVAPTGDGWTMKATKALVAASAGKVLKMRVERTAVGSAISVVLTETKPTKDVCVNYLLVLDEHAVSTGPGSSASTKTKYPVVTEEAVEMLSSSPKKTVSPQKMGAIRKCASKDVGSSSKEVENLGPILKSGVGGNVPGPGVSGVVTVDNAAVKRGSKGKEALRIQVKIVRSLSPDAIFAALLPNLPLIKAMMDEMALFYEDSEPEPRDAWKYTYVCAAYRESDNKWYRGIFISYYETDYAIVTLRDIATKEYIKLAHLRRLDERFMRVRDGAFLCQLAGIMPACGPKWSQAACERVARFFAEDNDFYITKKGRVTNQVLPIEMFASKTVCAGPLDPITEQVFSLNMSLVDEGLAIPIRGANEVQQFSVQKAMKDLEERPHPEGRYRNISLQVTPPADNDESGSVEDTLFDKEEDCQQDWLPAVNMDLDVFDANPTNVDHMGYIYLHDYVEAHQRIENMQCRLQEQFRNSAPNLAWEWKPKQMCVAKYHLDGKWYRAKTIQLQESGDWMVVFVDYGNEETCSETEMRPSKYLRQVPLQCHKCYLSNVAPVARNGRWTLEAMDFLHALVVDYRCTANLIMPPDTPDPIPIQLLRFDGVNVGLHMVRNGYARFVLQEGSRVRAPPDPSMAAIEPSPKSAPPLHSRSPHAGYNARYGARDSASGSKMWADELEDSIAVAECSVQSSAQSSSDASSKESLKRCLRSGFESVKVATEECVQSRTYVRSDLDSAHGAVSDNSFDLVSCPDSEEEWEEEEESEAAALGASSKSPPDLFVDAVQMKEAAVPIAESADKKKTVAGVKVLGYGANDLPTEDKFTVIVKSILSPTEVRVRIISDATTPQLTKLGKFEREMQTEAPQQPQIYEPVAGTACVALLGERWIRGSVVRTQKAGDDHILVQAVDHTGLARLGPECVLQLKNEWTELPPMLQALQLWQVTPAVDYSPADVKEYLWQVLVGKPLIARVKEREPAMLVELLHLDESTLAYQQLLDAAILVLDE